MQPEKNAATITNTCACIALKVLAVCQCTRATNSAPGKALQAVVAVLQPLTCMCKWSWSANMATTGTHPNCRHRPCATKRVRPQMCCKERQARQGPKTSSAQNALCSTVYSCGAPAGCHIPVDISTRLVSTCSSTTAGNTSAQQDPQASSSAGGRGAKHASATTPEAYQASGP